MNSYWLYVFLFLFGTVIMALVTTYQRLQNHKKLIRIQSIEIEKQLRELVRQNELQEKLNHEKQQVIGAVSHDLKGPFNRIFALVQLMEMSSNLSDEQKEYIGKIHQVAVDGLGMVRNLLDNRKLEDKGIDMTVEEINLSPLLHSLVKNYKMIADKKKIAVTFEAPKQSKVLADKNYLNRIFENLLSNAVKFSPPSTTVSVSIVQDETNWCVSVADEGPGITAEDQVLLFNKFQKLSAKPTGGESSTGLGLWIVKTLVEKSGGEVRCKSLSHSGTTFEVRLDKLS
jgi:signal transduction histidine kinase